LYCIMARSKPRRSKQKNPLPRKRVPLKIRKRGKKMVPGGMGVSELLYSSLNPFEANSCIPDGARGTGCFSTKQTFQASTGTGGSCVSLLLKFDPTSTSYLDTGSTASTPTISGNWAAAASSAAITNVYSKYRPISASIKINYTGATQTDSGVVLGCLFSPNTVATSFNNSSLETCAAASMAFKTFPLRNGLILNWRPMTEIDMSAWNKYSSTLTVNSQPSLPWLGVFVFGAASAQSVFLAETIVNYEGQFGNQEFTAGSVGGFVSGAPIVEGWYPKLMKVLDKVAPIMPLIGSAYTGYSRGGILGAIGNTLGYGPSGLRQPTLLSSNNNSRIRIEEVE